MPNGQSVIGAAATMTLGVAKGLQETHERMGEFVKHLESRRAHLEALLQGSHQDDVKEMIDEINAVIDALLQTMHMVQDAADRALKIEQRL